MFLQVCREVANKCAVFFLGLHTFFNQKQVLSEIEAMQFGNNRCADFLEQLTYLLVNNAPSEIVLTEFRLSSNLVNIKYVHQVCVYLKFSMSVGTKYS